MIKPWHTTLDFILTKDEVGQLVNFTRNVNCILNSIIRLIIIIFISLAACLVTHNGVALAIFEGVVNRRSNCSWALKCT